MVQSSCGGINGKLNETIEGSALWSIGQQIQAQRSDRIQLDPRDAFQCNLGPLHPGPLHEHGPFCPWDRYLISQHGKKRDFRP